MRALQSALPAALLQCCQPRCWQQDRNGQYTEQPNACSTSAPEGRHAQHQLLLQQQQQQLSTARPGGAWLQHQRALLPPAWSATGLRSMASSSKKVRRRLPPHLQPLSANTLPPLPDPSASAPLAAGAGPQQAAGAQRRPARGASGEGLRERLGRSWEPDVVAARMRLVVPLIMFFGVPLILWWAAESTIIRDGAAQLSSSSDWLVQNAARRQRWLLNGWLPFGLDQRFLELMLVQRIPERLVARMNPGLEPTALNEVMTTQQALMEYPEGRKALVRAGIVPALEEAVAQGWMPRYYLDQAAGIITALKPEYEQWLRQTEESRLRRAAAAQ